MRRAFAALVICGLTSVIFRQARAGEQQATLVIATSGQRTTYQIGERIPLDLSFVATVSNRFEINLASYDRSGRMSYEQFQVEPRAGWSDPLAAYFGAQAGILGGGLASSGVLSLKPTLLHLNLNEWVRFERPGNYTVLVTSHRVDDVLNANRSVLPSSFTLRSNPIDLTIVAADSSWQRAKLTGIVNELATEPASPGIQPPAREAAIADLRFLGTPEAAQVLAQHLRDDEPSMMYQCAFGLIGLPEAVRVQAVAAMKKLVRDPNFPVSSWFLETLSVMAVVPGTPEQQRADRKRLREIVWQSVLDALSLKKGTAKAETVETLLRNRPDEMPQPTKEKLGEALNLGLSDLSVDKQIAVLQSRDVVESPSLRPLLEQLAKEPLQNPGSNESHSDTTRKLKSIAFERWFELDPDGARQEALREIGSSHPSMTAESLPFLREDRLPQFESIWGVAFEETADYQKEAVLASLLAHHGAGNAVAIVREKAESKTGEWACAPQSAALAYLLKFDADSARLLIQRAIQARGPGKSACNHSIFQDLEKYSHDPILHELAVQSLDDPDPEVVADALRYLKSYGEASDEEAIANRYARWSQQWRGRAEELESRKAGSLTGNWQQIGLGESLASALIANQSWLASELLLQRALEECVGTQVCQQVSALVDRARAKPISISANQQGDNEVYEVAQYTAGSFELLSAKITQFPKGSEFVITSYAGQSEHQTHMNDRMKDLLGQHGMIVPPSPTPR